MNATILLTPIKYVSTPVALKFIFFLRKKKKHAHPEVITIQSFYQRNGQQQSKAQRKADFIQEMWTYVNSC